MVLSFYCIYARKARDKGKKSTTCPGVSSRQKKFLSSLIHRISPRGGKKYRVGETRPSFGSDF